MVAETPVQPKPAGAAAPPKVLVVDDEPVLAEEIVEYLRAQGFLAEAVADGHAALARLRENPDVTVMLSDIRMPGMDGLILAARAMDERSEAQAVEVVMLTGHASLDDAITAMRSRTIDFLRKPVQLSALRAALLRAHEAASARRARAREADTVRQARDDMRAELDRLRESGDALRQQVSRQLEGAELSDRSRREFLSVVNHELRTPLVPIIGFAEMIEKHPEDLSQADLRAYAGAIREAGERLQQITGNILDMTALETGTAERHAAMEDAGAVLAALVGAWRQRAEARGQHLATVQDPLPVLRTDRARLIQALDQIIDNAIRFAPPQSEIEISAHATPGGIAFGVHDHGPGMTEEQIALALRPFRQLDMSMGRRHGGIGLGLTLAARLAAWLGGRLEVRSAPGLGTEVVITLPLDPAPSPGLPN